MIYQPIKDIINSSKILDENGKEKYLKLVDDIAAGKMDDLDAMGEFNNYFERELTQLEQSALSARDAEMISLLADVRNAKTEMQKAMLGIEEDK